VVTTEHLLNLSVLQDKKWKIFNFKKEVLGPTSS